MSTHPDRRSRRDAITAAGEALLVEDDGTETPVTALTVERWPIDLRASSTFVCAGCKVRVRPWNIHSTHRTPTFTASPDPHAPDCRRGADTHNDDGSTRDARSEVQGSDMTVPISLVIPRDSVRAGSTDDTYPNQPLPSTRPRTRAGSTPRTLTPGGRSNHARALGRVVDAWIHMADRETRRRHPLELPDVDTDNYAYAFKRLDAWNGPIASSPPRVFYAQLRFAAAPIENGNLLTVTLQPTQPIHQLKTAPRLAHLIIDRTNWSRGRRAALRRELDWAYPAGRRLWTERRHGVTVFFLSHQKHTDTSQYTTTDQRLIYMTDHTITY